MKMWQLFNIKENMFTSFWWYFLFCPKQQRGYGPQQIMLVIGSKKGKIHIDGKPLNFKITKIGNKQYDINCYVNHWIYDGDQMHLDVVSKRCIAHFDIDKKVIIIKERETKQEIVKFIKISKDTFKITFVGGDISFSLVIENQVKIPRMTKNFLQFGIDKASWNKLYFQGRYNSVIINKDISGYGYYQQVTMTIPLFNWFWNWSVFKDGTIFGLLIPFIGFNTLKINNKLLNSTLYDKLNYKLKSMSEAYVIRNEEIIKFEQVDVTPIYEGNLHPQFRVCAFKDPANYLQFTTNTYSLGGITLSKFILGRRIKLNWFYNEYLVNINKLRGQIADKKLSVIDLGEGFGNLEYIWGFVG